jgi:hypothetical protein
MKSVVDWRIIRKHFLISFVGAMLFAILFCCFWFVIGSSGGRIAIIAFKYDHLLNAVAVGLLWCVCAGMSLRSTHILHVFAVASGLTWGTVFALTADDFIQNRDEVSFWLPALIHGSLVIPVIATVTVLPFWYFGRRRHNWNVRRTNYCLKIALITPLLLIGVYSATFSCYWILSQSKVTASQGRKMRKVSFQTSIHDYWRPAFWFVERVCRYEDYEKGGDDYIFRKFLDTANP